MGGEKGGRGGRRDVMLPGSHVMGLEQKRLYWALVSPIIPFDPSSSPPPPPASSRSFESIRNWVGQIQQHADVHVNKILIGNKCDMTPQRGR